MSRTQMWLPLPYKIILMFLYIEVKKPGECLICITCLTCSVLQDVQKTTGALSCHHIGTSFSTQQLK